MRSFSTDVMVSAAMLTSLGVQLRHGHGTFEDALLGGTTIEDVVKFKRRRLGSSGIAESGAGCDNRRRKPQLLLGCRVNLDTAGKTCRPAVFRRRSNSAAHLRKSLIVTLHLLIDSWVGGSMSSPFVHQQNGKRTCCTYLHIL